MLLVLLVVFLVACALGGFGHTRDWGYAGWSPLGIVLCVVLVLWLVGGLHVR